MNITFYLDGIERNGILDRVVRVNDSVLLEVALDGSHMDIVTVSASDLISSQ